jgi:hypothetical protein
MSIIQRDREQKRGSYNCAVKNGASDIFIDSVLENSPYCECRHGKETVEHYLLECRKYRDQGKKLKKVRKGMMWMEVLLGDPKIIKHMLEYIKETGRLDR